MNEVLEHEIPQLQEIAGKTRKKEEELKGVKSELAELDRKIQLELTSPAPQSAQGKTNDMEQNDEDKKQKINVDNYMGNKLEPFIRDHIHFVRPSISEESKSLNRGMKI